MEWAQSFSGNEQLDWSAEPQAMLIDAGMEKDVQAVLKTKNVFPFPSKGDGLDGLAGRLAIAKVNGFQKWKGNTKQTKDWMLQDGKFTYHTV